MNAHRDHGEGRGGSVGRSAVNEDTLEVPVPIFSLFWARRLKALTHSDRRMAKRQIKEGAAQGASTPARQRQRASRKRGRHVVPTAFSVLVHLFCI